MAVILSVVIPILEIPLNEDIYNKMESISVNHIVILFVIMLIIVSIVSVYSSRNKLKYFLTIFSVSVFGGHVISLVILLIFNKITISSLSEFDLIQMLLIDIIRFGALPSILISIGLLTPRKQSLRESLSH